jgi:hypothetical protein
VLECQRQLTEHELCLEPEDAVAQPSEASTPKRQRWHAACDTHRPLQR